ncbi:hypothetical protein [Vibrio phage RYC]|nr:hypothetical protein [Vibrio phage RYC]
MEIMLQSVVYEVETKMVDGVPVEVYTEYRRFDTGSSIERCQNALELKRKMNNNAVTGFRYTAEVED